MNWLTLEGLDEPPEGWLCAICEAGYEGVQFIEPLPAKLVEDARAMGLRVCGSGRVNLPEDAERLAAQARHHGLECLTLHVGWGNEEDDEALRLIEAVLHASIRHDIPLYVETHRATIFQDTWRSVNFVRRFPELLSARIFYAREIDGKEESDRWQQSLVLTQIARDCFAAARS